MAPERAIGAFAAYAESGRVGDERLLAGLEQAPAYANGDKTGAVTHDIAQVSDAVDVAAIRKALGPSQPAFASRYGFTVDAVRNWEQGRRQPDVAVRAYLTAIARNPDVVRRMLSKTQRLTA